MDLRLGRIPFEVRPGDRDYSGLSLEDRYLVKVDIERSFFNGVNLVNCAFDGVKMNNTEFSESKIQRSAFSASDLSGSDFVDSLLEDSSFVECNFEKGEWRDTTFRHCKFIDCNFDHTTVMLCRFIECKFDVATIDTTEHRAIYFNVFSHCTFGREISDSHFASRNFGVPTSGSQSALVPAGAQITIEQICLLNNIGRLRAIDVASVAESICASLATRVQRRTSTLIFFSKIIRVLTDERRISPTSLIYLEQIIVQFAGKVDDQDLFASAMSAIVEIRSALFSVATETREQPRDNTEGVARTITIRFDETYARHQAEALRDTLSNVASNSSNILVIESVRNGSTIIEMVSNNIISIGALFLALNFVLRQARVTVELVASIGRKLRKTRKSKKVGSPGGGPRRRPNKVPAVMKTGPVLPELAPVREAIRRHGRALVEMDERADVKIVVSIEQMQGR